MQLFDLKGKVALVTGATHGLGMAMAMGLGRAGAKIAINGHSSQAKIDKALQVYRENGIDANGYLFDVRNENDVCKGLEQIRYDLGEIDILINNAGIIKRTPLENMPLRDFEEVINMDLISPFIVSKAVVKSMIERRQGKIINICSLMSEVGRENVGAYAAAKGGLKMLTKNMASEWAKHNVQVNGIGPGYIATSQTALLREDGHPFIEFVTKRTPAGRWGTPSDLEGVAVFLASSASDFVNGQIIYVDGGILGSL